MGDINVRDRGDLAALMSGQLARMVEVVDADNPEHDAICGAAGDRIMRQARDITRLRTTLIKMADLAALLVAVRQHADNMASLGPSHLAAAVETIQAELSKPPGSE